MSAFCHPHVGDNRSINLVRLKNVEINPFWKLIERLQEPKPRIVSASRIFKDTSICRFRGAKVPHCVEPMGKGLSEPIQKQTQKHKKYNPLLMCAGPTPINEVPRQVAATWVG